LVTGSVPTENLPDKSHKAPKNERRPLVKKGDTAVVAQSPTSSQPEPQYSDIDLFTKTKTKQIFLQKQL
jgi:hypothetical protein